jgi:phosphonate transport system substrate-binding protein
MKNHFTRRGAAVAFGIVIASLATRSLRAQPVPRAVELGLLPNLSARTLLAQYQPMREFLERRLQQPVQVSTAPSWSAFHRRTAAREYDLIVTAANMARVAQLDSGYTPLVSYSPQIKGLVVFAKQRPLRSIDELRGQRLALSNPQSLVTLRGMQWLAEQGLKRGTDFATLDTPTDDSVGNLVVRGDCVAAMLSGGEFRAIPEDIRSQLQLLVNFADVPGFIVAASPRLTPAQAQAAKQALLEFAGGSDEGKAFFAATGFTAMGEINAATLEQLDLYVADTRRMFAAP